MEEDMPTTLLHLKGYKFNAKQLSTTLSQNAEVPSLYGAKIVNFAIYEICFLRIRRQFSILTAYGEVELLNLAIYNFCV